MGVIGGSVFHFSLNAFNFRLINNWSSCYLCVTWLLYFTESLVNLHLITHQSNQYFRLTVWMSDLTQEGHLKFLFSDVINHDTWHAYPGDSTQTIYNYFIPLFSFFSILITNIKLLSRFPSHFLIPSFASSTLFLSLFSSAVLNTRNNKR